MLNNFIKPGLEDLAVTRTTFDWGVKVNLIQNTLYMFGLMLQLTILQRQGMQLVKVKNYLTKYWPADVQVVGKENCAFPRYLLANTTYGIRFTVT